MLTYSSDPLPQIVCPMDEDANPPNTFCSAPPYSEPPPLLLPFSSINPSSSNDGSSGHRRSGRIKAQTPKKQSITDSEAAQRSARQNWSPSKRQRDTGSMVQVPHSEQPSVDSTHGHEKQSEEGCVFSLAAEQQKEQKLRRSSQEQPNMSPEENVGGILADNTTQNLDSTQFAMDTCRGLAVGHTADNASVPKGWVIGPLFQSFKSKMASFTEIVMSPVKLFRTSSPPLSMDHLEKLDECELEGAGTSDVELSKPSDGFYPVTQRETEGPDSVEIEGVQHTRTVEYSKKLLFDVEMSATKFESGDECSLTQTERNSPESVPLQHSSLPLRVSEEVSDSVRSSILLQPSVHVSAWHESKLKTTTSVEDQKHKLTVSLPRIPLPRKCTGNRRKNVSTSSACEVIRESESELIDEQVSLCNLIKSDKADLHSDKPTSLSSSGCYLQSNKDLPHFDDDDDDDDDGDDDRKLVRPNIQNNFSERAKAKTPKPPVETQQLQFQLNPEKSSAAGLGRAKREHKTDCHTQDFVKRKRFTAERRTEDTVKQELPDVVTQRRIGLKPLRKKAAWTDSSVDKQKPARRRPAVSTRANKREEEVVSVVNEDALNAHTKSSCDLKLCVLDKDSSVAEDTQKGSSSRGTSSSSRSRSKTKMEFSRSDADVDNSMDVETTVAFTQSKHEPFSEVFVRPDIKQLQSPSRCRSSKKKPLKRKSPNQAGSTTQTDSSSVSTSASLQLIELMPTDSTGSQESTKVEPNQPSKRPKRGVKGANKKSVSTGHEETQQSIPNLYSQTKENGSQESKHTMSVDPVYFEMTPSESLQPDPLVYQPHLTCYVKLENMDERALNKNEKSSASVADEVFPTDAEASINSDAGLRSAARGVNFRPRRVDRQRRRCRVLHSRTRKGAELTNSTTMDDTDLATHPSEGSSSRNLLRSYSCPEIHSLRHHDAPWTSSLHSPHHSRIHTPHQHPSSHSPFVHHAHKHQRRARRHTVCSLEVEREIAPLCLRKEVYPSRRSVPYDSSTHHLSPSIALSPTASLKVLATCFLSSPLAFLSKKVDSRGAASSPSHVSSPTSSSSIYPLSPSTWRLPGFFQRSDSLSVPLDSGSSGNPLECEIERKGQSEEEDDGGDTSSSSQEYEDAVLREEKSLSDSEIKVVKKLEERGKVSSIRIRKTLPKPQNNLTPMGLPKPVRLKKKEFSLEEIYTNKNFSKPPESRLETIFEVALNRKNGSESWFGQRRLKRFLEFLEVGEARKPKKPLVGAGKAGNSNSRTRRGGFPKDEPSLSPQDVDSLLCAKLDQLNLWLMHDQKDS